MEIILFSFVKMCRGKTHCEHNLINTHDLPNNCSQHLHNNHKAMERNSTSPSLTEDPPENLPESEAERELRNKIKKFRCACDQVTLLNNKLQELWGRYRRADRNQQKSFRYSLRIRLCVMEGVRDMFYEYVAKQGSDIQQLSNQIYSDLEMETLRLEAEQMAESAVA